jgi:hypothetical protein
MTTAVYTALSEEDKNLAAGVKDRVPGRPEAVNFKRYINRKKVAVSVAAGCGNVLACGHW